MRPSLKYILICTPRKKLAQASGGRHYIETVRDGGNVLREIETRPHGARQVDQIEQQTSVRDRPTGRMRVSAIGSGPRPPTAVLFRSKYSSTMRTPVIVACFVSRGLIP